MRKKGQGNQIWAMLAAVGFAVLPQHVALSADEPQAAAPAAQITLQGFYYDAKTNRYFTDGKAAFSIRPVANEKFLDHIEVSVDNGAFAPYKEKLRFDKEGLHQIRFRAADPLLNWSPLQDFRIYVDLTPPKSNTFWQGPVFQDDKATFVSPQSKLTLSATDTVSGIGRIAIEDGGKTSAFTSPMTFKGEGEHVMRFYAVDNVGNREPANEYKFFIDGKAPVTKAEVNGTAFKNANGIYVNSGAQVTLTAADEGSGIRQTEYQIDSGPVTSYKSPIPVTGKRVELKYRSVDRVDNTEAWKTLVINQDTAPPHIAVERAGNHIVSAGKIYASPGFSLEVKAKDDETGLAELQVSTDGKTFEKAANTKFTFTNPAESRIIFRAVDQVGNIAESDPYDIVIDNQPPKSELRANVKLAPAEGGFLSGVPNRLDIVGNDDGAGIDRVEYSYDGKTFSPFTQPIDLAQWNQSKRTIFYRSVDRLGNKEPVQQMTIFLRTEGPKVDLFVESEKFPDVPLSSLQQKSRTPAGGEKK